MENIPSYIWSGRKCNSFKDPAVKMEEGAMSWPAIVEERDISYHT